jgi:hypothetical protein
MTVCICVLCIFYYSCCHGNIIKGVLSGALRANVCVFVHNLYYYNHCHCNAIKGFSALWFV